MADSNSLVWSEELEDVIQEGHDEWVSRVQPGPSPEERLREPELHDRRRQSVHGLSTTSYNSNTWNTCNHAFI